MTTENNNTASNKDLMSHDTSVKDTMSTVDVEPSVAQKLLERFLRKSKSIEVRTWVIANGIQTVIETKKVKMGVRDITIGKNNYAIHYDYVQNVNGKLIYNTKHGVANGALSYVKIPKEVDAEFRSKLRARDNLHAIWSRWQLPFIACIISMIVAIIAIAVLAGIITQWQSALNCMNSAGCLADRLRELGAVTTNG